MLLRTDFVPPSPFPVSSPAITLNISTSMNTGLLEGQQRVIRIEVLPTQCIYVFCVDLRTNSDYFPMQH